MAILTYSGLKFSDWQTLAFQQEAVYDETDTDLKYVRITIQGECIISKPLAPSVALGDDTPVDTTLTARLVNQFMAPRQTLSFTVNGDELIPFRVGSAGMGTDAKNGPLPQYFNLVHIQEAAFVVQLKIVSHWAESTSQTDASNIVSHRWTESAEIDENFYTRKTRSGKVVVSSCVFKGQTQIDGLRNTLVTTGIDPGFQRVSSRYTVHESGLEMRYDLVDQEKFRVAPPGASSAEGDFSITTQVLGSPGRFATCRVLLRGPKAQNSNQQALIRQAIVICWTKLRAAGGFFPSKSDLRERMYENEIECTMTGRIKPRTANETFAKLLISPNGFGFPPMGSEPNTPSPNPGTRGTAGVLLHAAAYQDPTLSQTLNNADNSLKFGQGGLAPNGTGVIPGG